jgi:uncharacterized membrane protein YidH (DUF202 family)
VNGDQPEPPPADPGDRARDMSDAELGHAQERTDLAWMRNSISFLAVGIAMLKFRPAVGIPVLAIGVVVWLFGRRPRVGHHLIAARRVLLVTVTINCLAVVALVLTLAGPSSRGLRP